MIHFFVAVCFFLSGAAGLVYELLWIRLVDKVMGSAPFAVATVLSVFMAGLALGSYLAGRSIKKSVSRASLLGLYGKIELGIGFSALAVPFAIQAIKPLYGLIYDQLFSHFWSYQVAAFAGCTLILMVPAGLMGATLPVLCRFYVLHPDHIGSRTGRLYGLNTAGAAAGILLCGFLLIKSLGVWMTLVVFAGINSLIGLGCLILSRFPADKPGQSGHPPGHFDCASIPSTPVPSKFVFQNGPAQWGLILFIVSGFCAMGYEVLWTRLLGLIVGPTTYCFTLVVSAFIIGLALGSMLFGWAADKTAGPITWLAATQIGAAVSALAASQLLGNSQFMFAKLIHTFQGQFSLLMLAQSIALFFILLPSTLFLGAAFPLVNKLYTRSVDRLGRSLGTAYALNTMGALAGSFVAGFVLIPWMGKENGLRLLILIQFSFALLCLMFATPGRPLLSLRHLAAGLVLCAGVMVLGHYPSWRSDLLSRGWYRNFDTIEAQLNRTGWIEGLLKGPERIAGHRKGLDVVFQGEGIVGFTTVEKETTSLGTVEYALFNSGKADASSHGDRSTQCLSAHIPMLFHPHARNVMVLGLASGMTAGEILLYPVEKLDIVEINEQVVTACKKFFFPWNNRCLEDPRTHLIVQDGRNHLALTRASYDVIISEPSNPWMAGLANLYSLEFFQLVRQRLNSNGIFAQWIQSYEMDWDTFSLLGRTFAAAFSKNALVKVGPVDYLLLGFKNDANGFDWSAARKNAGFARQSSNVTFSNVNFLVHLILTQDLTRLFGAGRLHTDNRPFLEFSAPMKLYGNTVNIDKAALEHRFLSPETQALQTAGQDIETLMDLMTFSASANVPMFNLLPYTRLDPGQQARYKKVVMDYCGRVMVPSYDIFNHADLKACCADIQIHAIQKKISKDPSRSMDHYNLALALSAAGQKALAIESLRRAVRTDTANSSAVTALGLLLAQKGELDEASRLLATAAVLMPDKADPHKFLGMVERRKGSLTTAVTHLSCALALAPDDPVALCELGIAFLEQGRNDQSVFFLTKALTINHGDEECLYYLKLAEKRLNGNKAVNH